MPRLSLWNSGKKGADYKFFDRTISEFFGVGGTAVYIHAYLGVHEQVVSNAPAASNITSIQDVLYLENRDRKYSDVVIEMRGIYNVQDNDFNMSQFGLFLTGDTLFISFHLNDMIALLGRKIMPGDVLELPHQRDDLLLNDAPAINKFYVVEDVNRSSEGYSASWWPHIWRVKVSPMPGAQEFSDILNQTALDPLGLPMTNTNGDPQTIGDLMTTLATELNLNTEIVDIAQENVKKRYFETQQYFYIPAENREDGKQNPWIFTGDGIPPNGAVPVGSGSVFPDAVAEGSYYLRTDYSPPTLFQKVGPKWAICETDWRGANWSVMSRFMKEFVNNTDTVTFEDGTTAPVKTNLSKAIKPRADF